MLIITEMSWITPDEIIKILDAESGLTSAEINERLGYGSLTPGALNRHLRRLTQRQAIDRSWKKGGYVYYPHTPVKTILGGQTIGSR